MSRGQECRPIWGPARLRRTGRHRCRGNQRSGRRREGFVCRRCSAGFDDAVAGAHSWGALRQLLTQLSQNVTKMGTAVRGAGDAFEVTDDSLAGQFDGLF